jgi:pSer/pThr/pTyr-binding forkhead associated (FHA) protein
MDVSLYMFKDNGEPKIFPIEPGKTVIGRREDCELRIPLSEISRRHAELIVDENAVSLRDLGSVNGTYVNNHRISEQELAPGDHIIIGPVVFTVQIDGEPAKIRKIRTRPEIKRSAATESDASEKEPELAAKGAHDSDLDFGENNDDPISALEALAGSDADDTSEIDLDDSHLNLDLDDLQP